MSGGAYVFSTGYRLVIPYTYAARFKVASNGSNISEVGWKPRIVLQIKVLHFCYHRFF